jgi:hypothetical protein
MYVHSAQILTYTRAEHQSDVGSQCSLHVDGLDPDTSYCFEMSLRVVTSTARAAARRGLVYGGAPAFAAAQDSSGGVNSDGGGSDSDGGWTTWEGAITATTRKSLVRVASQSFALGCGGGCGCACACAGVFFLPILSVLCYFYSVED